MQLRVFLVVGIFAAAVHNIVANVLLVSGLCQPDGAFFIGYVVASQVTFFGNWLGVYGLLKANKILQTYMKFVFLALVVWFSGPLVLEFLSENFTLSYPMTFLSASAVFTLLSFLFNKHITFK